MKLSTPIISMAVCSTVSFTMAQHSSAADDATTKGNTTAAATAKAGSADKAAASTASGGNSAATQVANLKTEQQQLRRMGEAIKRTKRAAMDLIGECTQPVEMMGEIDIIGQDVIPIMPATSEGFANQYNPPRPKYINLHMSQLASLVPILQDDVNTLVIPDSEKTFATQPLADIKGYMNDLELHFKKLQEITKTDDYNQPQLTNESRGVDDACKFIDSARKKLMHEEDKLEKKEEKLQRDQEKGK
ncbi:MAG: hypothetical protein K2X81_04690 [Candidatus Obscuribacterales bacterium]|nr:hypothetical protein [Candidatus Obscuribacterales bacterium]